MVYHYICDQRFYSPFLPYSKQMTWKQHYIKHITTNILTEAIKLSNSHTCKIRTWHSSTRRAHNKLGIPWFHCAATVQVGIFHLDGRGWICWVPYYFHNEWLLKIPSYSTLILNFHSRFHLLSPQHMSKRILYAHTLENESHVNISIYEILCAFLFRS